MSLRFFLAILARAASTAVAQTSPRMKGGLLYGKIKREQCYVIYALRSLSSLGDMYLALGKNQGAAQAYSRAVTVNPGAADVHYKAGSGAGQAW